MDLVIVWLRRGYDHFPTARHSQVAFRAFHARDFKFAKCSWLTAMAAHKGIMASQLRCRHNAALAASRARGD